MAISSKIEKGVADQIAAVRGFNRFYTAKLGLLRRRHLDGEFSLTEARILYEIDASARTTASALCGILELDAGYVSRLLSALTRRRLVRQAASEADGREKLLTLTATGAKAVARLNEQSTMQIAGILANLNAVDRAAVVTALGHVRSILAKPPESGVQIVRVTAMHDEALAILHEYYEAVQVVQRDSTASVGQFLNAPASGMWLAYMGDKVVGCVVLRKLEKMAHASECKRLYVGPSARGNRVAERLMDALEAFAREQGVAWIYLDTYDDLKTAIALYERRGYERCERYNDNPQATLFMRKRLV